MEPFCAVVLLVLCSVVLTLSGVEADDKKSDDDSCTYFHQMDFDGDLSLTVDDFLNLVEIRRNLTGIITIPDQYQTRDEKIAFLVKQRVQLFALVNDSMNNDLFAGGVSLEVFVSFMRARRNTTELEQTIVNWITVMFNRFTSDPNHKNMTLNEFEAVFSVFRIEADAVIVAYNYIDENDDGMVSLDEMVSDAIDYFSLANDPNNNFIGTRIVDCDSLAKGDTSA